MIELISNLSNLDCANYNLDHDWSVEIERSFTIIVLTNRRWIICAHFDGP